jgi:hypothetical protein
MFFFWSNSNPNAINDMAFKNPYTSFQHHINEQKENDDRLATTSAFPLIKHTFDQEEYMINKNLSNQIIVMNDVENDNNDVRSNRNSLHTISSDVNSSLFNQENNELLPPPPTSSSILTNVNENRRMTSDIILSSVSKQKKDDYRTVNGPVTSHLPIMSTSSSSSSLSIPTPAVIEHKVLLSEQTKAEPIVVNNNQTESLLILISSQYIEKFYFI